MATILIVDDDSYLRGIYAEVFEEAEFKVLQAENGVEGLDLALKNKPDIIFTGIMMPKMTGFEMINQLRTSASMSNVPVVISSHLGREEDRKKAEDLGVKAFVIKGQISPKEVVNLVGNIVSDQIFQVEIDSDKLDGQRLKEILGIKGDIILELSPAVSGAKGEFQARVLAE